MAQIILILTSVLIYSFANAQSAPSNDVVIIKEQPNAIYEDSSEHNRMNKTYQFTVMPIGVGPGYVMWSGLNFGYILDRNSVLMLSLGSLNKQSRTCTGAMSCGISGNSIAMSYKKFTGNTFYFTNTLNYRNVKYKEAENFGNPSDYDYNFEGNALSLDFSIGNQWQWHNFTMGCDWIGVSIPVSNSTKNENISGDTASAQTSIDDHKGYFLESFSFRSLYFYIGASF